MTTQTSAGRSGRRISVCLLGIVLVLGACRTHADGADPPPTPSASPSLLTEDDPLQRAAAAIFGRMQDARDFSRLSEAERNFIVVWVMTGEVGNGGFDQYYFNSSGDQADLAPSALRAIDAHDAAAIAEAANALFGPTGPPTDRVKRWTAMDAIPESTRRHWNALDTEFYKITDVYDKLRTYLHAHEENFQR